MSDVSLLLESGDDISFDDAHAYGKVIGEAFAVHRERERIRHGLWKEYPADAQARQVKIKADRVEHNLRMMQEHPNIAEEMRQECLEELKDIINYVVFTWRKLDGTA